MVRTTTATQTKKKKKVKAYADQPPRVTPARKAKSKTSSEGSSRSAAVEKSPVKGKKRQKIKTSDESKKGKKRRSEEETDDYVPSIRDLFNPAPRNEDYTIEDLLPDLSTSYVGRFEAPSPPARPERRTWPRQPTDEPLVDPDNLPPGWSMTEPDLDQNDLDAQIERCEVRIAENIMPHIFQHKLEQLKMEKAEEDVLVASEPGTHSWDVLKRLEMLRELEVELRSEDRFDQLANVQALLQAYRQGRLNWNQGLVTYWSRGVQLCKPRPFSWDEFEVLNKHHSGRTGFWMEGLVGPSPRRLLSAIVLFGGGTPPASHFTRNYEVAVRIPGNNWWSELRFCYDTGADIMTLYQGDLQFLMGNSQTEPTCMGMDKLTFANMSSQYMPVVELEVSILDVLSRRRMTNWVRVQCQVFRGHCTPTAPNNNDDMVVSNVHSHLVNNLPNTDDQPPQPIPYYRVNHPYRWATLMPRGKAPGPKESEVPAPVLTQGNMPGFAGAQKTPNPVQPPAGGNGP
ncbi:hypothetical protein N7457_001867 [Penicillium paradoxum]|uniref:uncharacterized protein n=1 Tax=Penicillium paradoxum TaxID=176176 RepID=UPI0025466203|nr:uncharacterized protein N7457_001867 [Penicillium paradoxum]KAJ5795268.1 hypothetical protein N7457_001867 [Penicillium paradoxum]